MSGLEELRRLRQRAAIAERSVVGALRLARNDVPRILDALDAVMALHVPYPEGCEWPGVPGECSGCRTEEDMCCGDHTWPCPTVAAITKALEGKN